MMLKKFRCRLAFVGLSIFCLIFSGFLTTVNVQKTFADEAPAPEAPADPATPAPEQPATPEAPKEPENPPAPTPEPPTTPETPATPVPENPPAPAPEAPAAPTAPEAPKEAENPPATPEQQPIVQETPKETKEGESLKSENVEDNDNKEDLSFLELPKAIPSAWLWHTNSKYSDPRCDDWLVVQAKDSSEFSDKIPANFEWGVRTLKRAEKKKDVLNGIRYIEVAATNDYPPAAMWISEHYRTGKYYHKDIRQSFLWCQKAANQGQPEAQYFLALFYTGSRAVRPNNVKSAQLCRSAADNNYPPAMAHLGTLYQTGLGVPQNDKLAVQWFTKGALMKDPKAQYQLGMCYDKGAGVKANSIEAFKWINLSASQGYAMSVSERRRIAKHLSKAQLAEGQRLSLKFSQLIDRCEDVQKLNPLVIGQPIEDSVTGFVVATNGLVLTTYKPFIDCSRIYVRNADGYFEAKLLKSDIHNNLAILKIDNSMKSIVSGSQDVEQIPMPAGTLFKPLALSTGVSLEMSSALFTVGFGAHDALVWKPLAKMCKLKDFIGINDDTRCLQIDIVADSHDAGAPILTPNGQLVGILDVASESPKKDKDINYHNALRSEYAAMLLASLPQEEQPQPVELKEQKFDDSLKQVLDAIVQIIIF